MQVAPTHPGEIFAEEYLAYSTYNQSAAAAAMGMSINRLSEIILGKRSVTAETALLFGQFTGSDPAFWMRLQANHDLWQAMQTTDISKVPRAKFRKA